ncbi:MAG: hypothetical protein M3R53_06225 [Candidatus Eremiobacteraeota bacterium]|nr:hypothetical protein [Candidatus Eremiobacteraeota bacterium]
MMDADEGFTAQQAAAANSALRAALGLPPERFATEQLVGMLSDEIEQLRSAGKTDHDIAGLLSESIGANIGADAISSFYAGPDERRPPG